MASKVLRYFCIFLAKTRKSIAASLNYGHKAFGFWFAVHLLQLLLML